MFTKFRLNHWGSRDKKKIKNFLVFFSNFLDFTAHGPDLAKVTDLSLDHSKWVRK